MLIRTLRRSLGAVLLPAAIAAAQSSVTVTAPGVTPADITFMQEMIGHHQQAVEMTGLLKTRSRDRMMQTLAERIEVSQSDEIAMMKAWLVAHGASLPVSHDMSQHGDHAMPMMPGMLSPAQMAALRAARGSQFDRLFLEGMIQHHGGALTMVAELLKIPGAAQESSINRFVTDVDADQRAEILRMRRMRAQR